MDLWVRVARFRCHQGQLVPDQLRWAILHRCLRLRPVLGNRGYLHTTPMVIPIPLFGQKQFADRGLMEEEVEPLEQSPTRCFKTESSPSDSPASLDGQSSYMSNSDGAPPPGFVGPSGSSGPPIKSSLHLLLPFTINMRWPRHSCPDHHPAAPLSPAA